MSGSANILAMHPVPLRLFFWCFFVLTTSAVGSPTVLSLSEDESGTVARQRWRRLIEMKIPQPRVILVIIFLIALGPMCCITCIGLRDLARRHRAEQAELAEQEGKNLVECPCGNHLKSEEMFCRMCGKARGAIQMEEKTIEAPKDNCDIDNDMAKLAKKEKKLNNKSAAGSAVSRLDGVWQVEGQDAGTIIGDTLVWATGKQENSFKRTSDTTISFNVDKAVYKGILKPDGKLYWNDGDVWIHSGQEAAGQE